MSKLSVKSKSALMAALGAFTPAQRKLAKKHGTPAEFAKACYEAVPGFISMDEARAAVNKYNAEWEAARRAPSRPLQRH